MQPQGEAGISELFTLMKLSYPVTLLFQKQRSKYEFNVKNGVDKKDIKVGYSGQLLPDVLQQAKCLAVTPDVAKLMSSTQPMKFIFRNREVILALLWKLFLRNCLLKTPKISDGSNAI